MSFALGILDGWNSDSGEEAGEIHVVPKTGEEVTEGWKNERRRCGMERIALSSRRVEARKF